MNNETNAFAATQQKLADTVVRSNAIAFEGFGRIVDLSMRAFEQRISSNMAFLSQLVEVRDVDALRDLTPKGTELVRDASEQIVNLTQQTMAQTVKTGEAIAKLMREGTEEVSRTVEAEVRRNAAANKKNTKS